MLKRAVKEFALRAQQRLTTEIKQNASQMGISPQGISQASEKTVPVGTDTERRERLRRQLINDIRRQEKKKANYTAAYNKVLSDAAFSCFFSLIALRFLESNDFLPAGEGLFTTQNMNLPPFLSKEGLAGLNLNPCEQKHLARLQRQQNNDELFTFLFIKKSQKLEADHPSFFLGLGVPDYSELLFSLSHENEDSLLLQLLRTIPEADFDLRRRGQVEIIGWFYQYYIEQQRDEIISLNVKKIKKADIPIATQVFTPDWLVRYLLDNSLGRYWLERNPDSALREKLEFFAAAKSENKSDLSNHAVRQIKPQQLTMLDPCVGSGHILLYAFDLLMNIYQECGYDPARAAREIVRNNLHGMDIDPRVVCLANFAVTMKARSYDPEFFDSGIKTQIFSFEQSNNLDSVWPKTLEMAETEATQTGEYLLAAFREAKEIGSLLQVETRNYSSFIRQLDLQAAKLDPAVMENIFWLQEIYPVLKNLAQQAQSLSRKYCVVCTNPPYMNRFTGILKSFVQKNYSDYSRDLFSVYIYRNFLFCRPDGYSALMTPYVWMFIKSYEKLRRFIIGEKAITTLVQLEYSAFDAAVVPLCAFVLKNTSVAGKGLYIKLSEFSGGLKLQRKKLLEALEADNCSFFYESDASNFCKLPSTPIAYWASEQVFNIFEKGVPMHQLVEARQGLASGDNARFLRLWFEVKLEKIKFDASSVQDFHRSEKLYAPHDKGGRYRRWYGNNDYVIKFDRENFKILAGLGNCLPSRQFYFREAISWSLITSAGFSARYRRKGSVPNVAGNSAFSDDPGLLKYLLALLSTPIADYLFKMLNPTLNLNVGDFDNFPVITHMKDREKIHQLVTDCINLAKSDWDSFENSPDFVCDPLADFPLFQANYLSNLNEKQIAKTPPPQSLSQAYDYLKTLFKEHFELLKQKEAELNRIFINLYDLGKELEAAPKDRNISSRLIYDVEADVPEQTRENRYILYKRDVVKNFISYAVACIYGRYSLDEPGIVFAGDKIDVDRYTTFRPSRDGVVTLSDREYFDDDIVNRLAVFVEKIYGSSKLEENLNFIASGLSKNFKLGDDPRSSIRSYFLREFYKDHCKKYSVSGSGKRPIYWLFDSGRENGFKAFVYLHAFNKNTCGLIRKKYLQRQIRRYKDELQDLQALTAERLCVISPSEQKRRQVKLQRQLLECKAYDEKLKSICSSQIELDLDDGVLVNYQKLQTSANGENLGILALT